MSEHAQPLPDRPDVSHLVTEDDEPVDNLPSEKQQRLLVDALYASWPGPPSRPDDEPPADDAGSRPGGRREFVAASNVGVWATPRDTPIVPDVLVGVDVELQEPLWQKEHRSYFIWEMGSPPALAIEIVSNREGGELGRKKARYGRMRVASYVVYDPQRLLGDEVLHAFTLAGDLLRALPLRPDVPPVWLDDLGLGLRLWEGSFEGMRATWLRFCDVRGVLLPTGAERAQSAEQRAERLAATLRELGVDPNDR